MEAVQRSDVGAQTGPDGSPPATLATRLFFAWFAVLAVLVTIPMSLLQAAAHRMSPTTRTFRRYASRWGRFILRGMGIRVRVEERETLAPEGPYVFVSNHQNLLDILALAAGLPYPFGFVAKVELAKVPFLGFAIRHSASVFIDRSEPRRALESLQQAGARIRAGMSVLVFPEGERTYNASMHPLKKGAFAIAVEAGVPLVPVTILDAYRLMNEQRRTARPGVIHIVVGRPIPMAGRHRRDIPAIMESVQAGMAAELGAVP